MEIHNLPNTRHCHMGIFTNEIVIHEPYGCNWRFNGVIPCSKNPRSGNRKVKVIGLYHGGVCAVISPVSGHGKGIHYLCNTEDLRKR